MYIKKPAIVKVFFIPHSLQLTGQGILCVVYQGLIVTFWDIKSHGRTKNEVAAVSGKPDDGFLTSLGVTKIIHKQNFTENIQPPLLPPLGI